ncbi:hypothetical protein [Yoonia vestfoldensis]|jgi:TRAP-type C4-dicarboxylate transport system permease small subunit|uniref:Uncharacterized protein n=1 Tax=Yoonia vestfoldensis TaxID=245188 RepID=A0A1Y0E9I7_9RHOB|nr:hypothetical protein [Yoonia vestfoldensis]ARU00265.1 hypothetical protein LOKVESSMR4R_00934 [Yoonia vestfoldensis]
MTQDPKSTRAMPRSLIYAMIPIGFLLLVLVLILSGVLTQEAVDDPRVVVEDEDQTVQDRPAP